MRTQPEHMRAGCRFGVGVGDIENAPDIHIEKSGDKASRVQIVTEGTRARVPGNQRPFSQNRCEPYCTEFGANLAGINDLLGKARREGFSSEYI